MSNKDYYVPSGSYWPFVGSIALTTLFSGFASSLHGSMLGQGLMLLGLGILFFMMFGWLGQVVEESEAGLYNQQVGRSFRWGMGWFIVSEVMFFAAFFGALFYARVLSVPWLGGESIETGNIATNVFLWPDFVASWPLLTPPDVSKYTVPTGLVDTWHLPALNTLILLMSGVTITWAHWALKLGKRNQLIAGMIVTVALGVLFLGFQAEEYIFAYNELNLKLSSGIYGSTFYMLTGFHGFHVTVGVIMLIVILMRCVRGHFNKEHHFAFEGVAWYWHFVDVVWLGLFIFVYWL